MLKIHKLEKKKKTVILQKDEKKGIYFVSVLKRPFSTITFSV